MTVSQDQAEKLIALYYGVGQQNVVASNSGTAITLVTPDVASVQAVTLNGVAPAITVPTPLVVGQKFTLYVIQDGTGSRVPTWAGATINWLTGSAPTLSKPASAVDKISFESLDGATWEATVNIGSPPAVAAVSAVTLSSGTAVQDATGAWSTWYIEFTGSGTGTAAIAIGPSSGVADAIVPAIEVPATVGACIPVRLPPNWYVKATVTGGVAIVAATAVVTG